MEVRARDAMAPRHVALVIITARHSTSPLQHKKNSSSESRYVLIFRGNFYLSLLPPQLVLPDDVALRPLSSVFPQESIRGMVSKINNAKFFYSPTF